jgi:hypothetical protein
LSESPDEGEGRFNPEFVEKVDDPSIGLPQLLVRQLPSVAGIQLVGDPPFAFAVKAQNELGRH